MHAALSDWGALRLACNGQARLWAKLADVPDHYNFWLGIAGLYSPRGQFYAIQDLDNSTRN